MRWRSNDLFSYYAVSLLILRLLKWNTRKRGKNSGFAIDCTYSRFRSWILNAKCTMTATCWAFQNNSRFEQDILPLPSQSMCYCKRCITRSTLKHAILNLSSFDLHYYGKHRGGKQVLFKKKILKLFKYLKKCITRIFQQNAGKVS